MFKFKLFEGYRHVSLEDFSLFFHVGNMGRIFLSHIYVNENLGQLYMALTNIAWQFMDILVLVSLRIRLKGKVINNLVDFKICR